MARWYLAAFTTGKRYSLFRALKRAFVLMDMADRCTYLGEYKYEGKFDVAFKECIEFIRDIHELDETAIYGLQQKLAKEKFRLKNKIPSSIEIKFDDLEYRDWFPDSFRERKEADLDLLEEMVEDCKIQHELVLERKERYISFYERMEGLSEILWANDRQTSKFAEYSCDPKYWS